MNKTKIKTAKKAALDFHEFPKPETEIRAQTFSKSK